MQRSRNSPPSRSRNKAATKTRAPLKSNLRFIRNELEMDRPTIENGSMGSPFASQDRSVPAPIRTKRGGEQRKRLASHRSRQSLTLNEGFGAFTLIELLVV